MGFVWEHADSFLHCVASPFHSFVTTCACSRIHRIEVGDVLHGESITDQASPRTPTACACAFPAAGDARLCFRQHLALQLVVTNTCAFGRQDPLQHTCRKLPYAWAQESDWICATDLVVELKTTHRL